MTQNTFKNNTEPKRQTRSVQSTVYPDGYKGSTVNQWRNIMQPVFDGLHKTPDEYNLLNKQLLTF